MTKKRRARHNRRLGIQAVERTFSGCRLVFNDPTRSDYLSLDSVVRDDFLRKWAHIAIPVLNKQPGFPILAGIVTPKSFKEVERGFGEMARKYAGMQELCVEGLEPPELPFFFGDHLRDGGVSLIEVETTWKRVLTILEIVFGRFY